MKYRFTMEPGLRGHSLMADLTISDDGIECNKIFMERGSKSRRLCPKMEAEVEDYLVGCTPEIFEQHVRDVEATEADWAFKRSRGE